MEDILVEPGPLALVPCPYALFGLDGMFLQGNAVAHDLYSGE
jgi:hypothetical protein